MANELSTPGVRFSLDTEGVEEQVKSLLGRILPPKAIVDIALVGGGVIADAWRTLEAPHNVTHEYQDTIRVHIVEKDEHFCEIAVGTTAKQARFLEWGTSKETAQPVMRPAYDMARGPAAAKMQAAILQASRGNLETPQEKASAAASRTYADVSAKQMAAVQSLADEVAKRQRERGGK